MKITEAKNFAESVLLHSASLRSASLQEDTSDPPSEGVFISWIEVTGSAPFRSFLTSLRE